MSIALLGSRYEKSEGQEKHKSINFNSASNRTTEEPAVRFSVSVLAPPTKPRLHRVADV